MQTLLTSLVSGTTEYGPEGTTIQKPPTATMLRAARELTTLANINATNNVTINMLQLRVEDQLNEITQLQELLNDANKRNTDLQNLRNDSRQERKEVNSDVGCSSEQPCGSDSDGEGRGTN